MIAIVWMFVFVNLALQGLCSVTLLVHINNCHFTLTAAVVYH